MDQMNFVVEIGYLGCHMGGMEKSLNIMIHARVVGGGETREEVAQESVKPSPRAGAGFVSWNLGAPRGLSRTIYCTLHASTQVFMRKVSK